MLVKRVMQGAEPCKLQLRAHTLSEPDVGQADATRCQQLVSDGGWGREKDQCGKIMSNPLLSYQINTIDHFYNL